MIKKNKTTEKCVVRKKNRRCMKQTYFSFCAKLGLNIVLFFKQNAFFV